MTEATIQTQQREFGIQPIDRIMQDSRLINHDVVAASDEQLTHKMIAKARRGRWLSTSVRHKICRALNKVLEKNYRITDLFNYR